jgi:hypothetical protein
MTAKVDGAGPPASRPPSVNPTPSVATSEEGTSTEGGQPFGSAFICYQCHRLYLVPKGLGLACAAIHQPGTCCHYGEVRAETVYTSGWTPPVIRFP